MALRMPLVAGDHNSWFSCIENFPDFQTCCFQIRMSLGEAVGTGVVLSDEGATLLEVWP